MVFKQDEVLKGLGISLLGGYGLYWVYNLPCTISVNPAAGIPEEMLRVACLSADIKYLIIMLVASAALFGGVSKIIQNL